MDAAHPLSHRSIPGVPLVEGQRLGLVVGSSLDANPLPVDETREFEVIGVDGDRRVIEIDDCGGVQVLMRHGRDGTTPAHLVDHHAHIRALCGAGCGRILALGSGGGLRPELGPGSVVAPDDFFALTTYPTFHETTLGYAMAAFDARWRRNVVSAWRASATSPIVDGGTYAMVRGPRFETKAEIRMLAQHADIVGMTLPAECVLAGEASLAYAAVCKIDNLANGVAGHALEVEEYRENARRDAAAFVVDLLAVLAALTR